MTTAPMKPTNRPTERGNGGRTLDPGLATILLLAALAAVGQFASNVYIPSLPFIAADLGVDASLAQGTFAIFLAAFAVSQLICGPLADRFGRRPILFGAFAVFFAGTLACALAPNLTALMIARAVQASGAAGALIVSRAATRDSFEGVELQKTMAAITIAFAVVPGLTPLIGGIVQEFLGWRWAFWMTLLLGSVLALIAFRSLPETGERHTAPISAGTLLAGYRAVLTDRVAMTYALGAGLVFAAMSAFFAASATLYIGRLGVGAAEYGLYPPIAVTGFIIGGVVTRRMAGNVEPARIAAVGFALMATALLAMLALPASGIVHKHLFNATMVLNVTGLGVFLPIAISQVLSRFPDRAGTASALQGFIQMSSGALGAVTVSALQPALPLLAMPMVMLAAVLLAVLVMVVGLRPFLRPAMSDVR